MENINKRKKKLYFTTKIIIFTKLPNPIRETQVLKLVLITRLCLKFWALYKLTISILYSTLSPPPPTAWLGLSMEKGGGGGFAAQTCFTLKRNNNSSNGLIMSIITLDYQLICLIGFILLKLKLQIFEQIFTF